MGIEVPSDLTSVAPTCTVSPCVMAIKLGVMTNDPDWVGGGAAGVECVTLCEPAGELGDSVDPLHDSVVAMSVVTRSVVLTTLVRTIDPGRGSIGRRGNRRMLSRSHGVRAQP